MTYEIKTMDEIMSEIKINLVNNVDGINDLNVGSVIETLISTISNTISDQYGDLEEIYDASRISSASGDDLDEIGLIVGIERDSGTKATGNVTFMITSPLSTDLILSKDSQVSTQPNSISEQLIYNITEDTTFSKEISEEEHTYKDGLYDYKLNQRFIDSISTLKGTSSGSSYTFTENTDFEVVSDFDGTIVDYDDFEIFTDCDSITNWSNSGGADAPTLNTTTKYQGTASINQIKSGTTYNYLTYTYDIGSGNEKNITDKSIIMRQYIKDSTALNKINKITVYVSSDSLFNNSKEIEYDADELSTGWNLIILDPNSSSTTTNGNIDLVNARYLKIKIELNNTTDTIASGDLMMDIWAFSTYDTYQGDIIRWIYQTGTLPDDDTIFKTSYTPLSWEVPIEAASVGVKYNVTKNKINYKVSSFPSINTINNYESITGGIDEETDDELRERIENASSINNVATVNAIEANVLNFSYIKTCNVIDMPESSIENEDHTYSSLIGKFELNQKVPRDDSNLVIFDVFANINTAITDTDTTIPFDNCSDFASKGVIKIEDEKISFTGNTGTALTGCTRGYDGTTAVAHDSESKAIELSFYDSLSAGITDTDTTITLVDATDFYASGVVLIDSEYIKYTGKSGNSLTGCTRGWEGTTAVSHSSAATVTRSTYERNTDFILTNDFTIKFYSSKNEPIDGSIVYVDYDIDKLGYFDVYVTGVSGEVNSTQLNEITDYITNEVKSAGIKFEVKQPTYITVNVSATITYASGYSYSSIGSDIEDAISDYITNLNIGDDVLYAKLISTIMGVTGVDNVSVTSPSSDFAIASDEKALPGTITLS